MYSLREFTARAIATVLTIGCTVAYSQTYITPTTPGWSFVTETPTGSGVFVNGPGVAPSGSPGSIQLTVGQPGGEAFLTAQYGGVRLDQLKGLSYNTYVVSSALPETANLQFDFEPGVTSTGYQGRAVFAPSFIPSAVTVGTWQTWNPMTQRGWWGTSGGNVRLLSTVCTQAAPCTFAEMLAAFPNSTILSPGAFGFKVGNSNSAAVVSVDSFTIGTTGAAGPTTRFNFALAAPFVAAEATVVPALGLSQLLMIAMLAALVGMFALRKRLRLHDRG
jgi:hypothetical protein